MWILASAQSTSVPFIQILPVPGSPMTASSSLNDRPPILLEFSTKRAPIRARVQRLPAVPAEPRRLAVARPDAALDLPGRLAVVGWSPRRDDDGNAPPAPRADPVAARGEQVVEQLARPLVAIAHARR